MQPNSSEIEIRYFSQIIVAFSQIWPASNFHLYSEKKKKNTTNKDVNQIEKTWQNNIISHTLQFSLPPTPTQEEN